MSPGPEAIPEDADIDTCLRVLAQAREAVPGDPRWVRVQDAAAQVYRAGKKSRKTARHADRQRHDRDLLSGSARFRDQNPSPEAESPTAVAAPAPPTSDRRLIGTPSCYVCKVGFQDVHPDYHLLCPDCAALNAARRTARCDLTGRRAIVTGGRVKIGFHVALKLLRDGAEVLVVTRFPRDAARRFAAVPDAADWLARLHVHGTDLLDLTAVAGLLGAVHERFSSLDILVNNAAQTVRRPQAYYREVRAGEDQLLAGLAARVDVTDAVTHGQAAALAERTGLLALPVADGTLAAQFPAELFPVGLTDETGQPLDLRERNSWSLRLHEVDPGEWVETHLVNAFAPFLLTARLRGLLESSPWPDRYVVQVSAMEGSFSRKNKTVRHPHTNMAKASLNMLTRTAAADYATSGIYMNSVDTGWVTDERPHPDKLAQRAAGFRPPLDVIDGAARVYDPIVLGVHGDRVHGKFLKDYQAVEW